MISWQTKVKRTGRTQRQPISIHRRGTRGFAGIIVVWMLSLLMAGAAETLSNGSLIVTIGNNGAIHPTTYKGHEYFRNGTFVSDYGMQEGGSTSTFLAFDAYGSRPRTVSVTKPNAGVVRATGTFSVGSAPVQFTQDYSLIPGKNVLRVDVSFKNTAADAKTIRYFTTFDPDMRDPGRGR
jgi:hypothetical protein